MGNQVIEKPNDQSADLTQQQAAEVSVIDPMQLVSIAVNQGADIDKLEKLMELQERFEANKARKAFDAAISAARAEIKPIVKDARVDFENKSGGRTQYKHETLDGIAEAIDPILSNHGLSYRFRSRQEASVLHVTCIVAHADGHSEETELSGGPDASGNKNPYQAMGSAATYLQRYTLKLALGLSAAKDNDAQGAREDGKDIDNTGAHPLTPAMLKNLRNAIAMAGITEEQMCAKAQIDRLQDMQQSRMKGALNYLKKLSQGDDQ